jgi:hypothetical protein
MILQLFIFALVFVGFGFFSVLKRKKFVGLTFVLMGSLLLIVALFVAFYYPHTLFFKL